jgi:DNA modification methylase
VSVDYLIGDVFDRLREIPDGSIDVAITSPPFLALRSYLPADHPDKGKEIGSEATPAAFLDTLLALTAEWGRVLAPHGSLCVELGDTYSGSGGGGGDYLPGGWRENEPGFAGSAQTAREGNAAHWRQKNPPKNEQPDAKYGAGRDWEIERGRRAGKRDTPYPGWPLAKSLTGIPTLYPWSLAYGRNLLTGADSPAGRWRIRNVIVWARPNPPVGALGDKFRPATSYITVACRGARRFFDLDAVRTEHKPNGGPSTGGTSSLDGGTRMGRRWETSVENPAGAPPLDWHTDHHPEDGDWLWKLSTQPYRGAHYATFPLELPTRLIMAMCPLRVCVTCGKPSERITGEPTYTRHGEPCEPDAANFAGLQERRNSNGHSVANHPTTGWSDCGHNTWRTGRVLDPFAGSGTTLQAAQNVGRHAVGIDLDPRNANLAQDRVGMFLTVNERVSP